MKRILSKSILAGLSFMLIVSCGKNKEFVGTPVDSKVMMLGGSSSNRKTEIVPLPETNALGDGDIVNPWANEKFSGKAENGNYDSPLEINIETFRHIQRFVAKNVSDGLEQTFDAANGNPWVTKFSKEGKLLFVSVPIESEIPEIYKTVAKINGTRAVRIPGKEGSPDLLELINDATNDLSEIIIIPRGLPDLRVNNDFECFEFSEKEKKGTVAGQLYIFPSGDGQKKVNMGLVRFTTEEFSEPAKDSAGHESVAPGSELLLISKSSQKLDYDGKLSYWFQAIRGDRTFWVPGYNLYLQTGTFNRLNDTTDIVYVPLTDGENWFRISDEYADGRGLLRPRQIVYSEEVSADTYEKDGRSGRYYRISYPQAGEIFGIYLDEIDDIHGSYSSYPDNSERDIFYSTQDDPYVTIYEGPNARYRTVGKKFEDGVQDGKPVTVRVNGFTDIQDVIHDIVGQWYSVSSPVNGFIFVEQD